MEYTLSEVHEKIRQFADKMGSDYFPLPVILNYFQTASYDFIGERLKHIELTQEITDDIRPLIVSRRIIVVRRSDIFPNVPSLPPNGNNVKFTAAIPIDYLRTVSYDVIYENGDVCRRADLLTQAEYKIARNDPHREPNKRYPLILQESNFFQINCGETVPHQMYLVYCKIPDFATTGEPNKRIVNLPNDSIEKILLHTITSMFSSTADERVQSNLNLEETFRKVFK